MSLYTHWVCFDCRKSFHRPPVGEEELERKCPECQKAMIDMGIYFEPPRRQAKRAWEIVRLLSENGYRFQDEGDKAYIDTFILGGWDNRIKAVSEFPKKPYNKRPRKEEIRQGIEKHKQWLERIDIGRTLIMHKERKERNRRIKESLKPLPKDSK